MSPAIWSNIGLILTICFLAGCVAFFFIYFISHYILDKNKKEK